jgi:hypothetical protein
MLSLIGLAHRAQTRKREAGQTEAQQAFAQCLRRTIENARPAFIGEEHSEEALAELGEISIAKEIADELGIEHRSCDPNKAERALLGYKDGSSLQLEMFMRGDDNHLTHAELRLKAGAIEIGCYFPIRESFWLERLHGCRDVDAIFICGDGHIDTFGRLLDENRVPYHVVERGIGLTAEDFGFDEAVQYLKDHPDVIDECPGRVV